MVDDEDQAAGTRRSRARGRPAHPGGRSEPGVAAELCAYSALDATSPRRARLTVRHEARLWASSAPFSATLEKEARVRPHAGRPSPAPAPRPPAFDRSEGARLKGRPDAGSSLRHAAVERCHRRIPRPPRAAQAAEPPAGGRSKSDEPRAARRSSKGTRAVTSTVPELPRGWGNSPQSKFEPVASNGKSRRRRRTSAVGSLATAIMAPQALRPQALPPLAGGDSAASSQHGERPEPKPRPREPGEAGPAAGRRTSAVVWSTAQPPSSAPTRHWTPGVARYSLRGKCGSAKKMSSSVPGMRSGPADRSSYGPSGPSGAPR